MEEHIILARKETIKSKVPVKSTEWADAASQPLEIRENMQLYWKGEVTQGLLGKTRFSLNPKYAQRVLYRVLES